VWPLAGCPKKKSPVGTHGASTRRLVFPMGELTFKGTPRHFAEKLPAEITGLERDGRRQPLLDDIDLRADAPRSRANELFLGDSAQDDPQIFPLPPLSRLLSKLPWPCLPEINYSITSDPANARKRRWVSTKIHF
jgi:hypothetical protein